MKICVVIISKKLEKYYINAINEYDKRLSRYCKIKLIICKNNNELRKKISKNSYKINISPSKSSISSEELAEKINIYSISGISDITLILNSSYTHADETISISPMDMNAGLLTTIVYEQIYRAYRIINNQAYHK